MKAQFPDEQTTDGHFNRQEDAFRQWVTTDGSSPFPAEKNRYHLYVSLACPWAHRIIIMRKLKSLESVIGMTVVDPLRNDDTGWAFREGEGHSPDPLNGFHYLKEAYLATDPHYRGRVTVPVLWDTQTKTIVSNSDDDLLRMLNTAFDAFTENRTDLYPEPLWPEIDQLNDRIYQHINNGVYKAGFATSQTAYEQAVYALFDTLDQLEQRLATQTYLFGSALTETDIRLFVTLIRFDAVYVGHFKCNLRRILDYPHLHCYMTTIRELPFVKPTINLDHIKRHYYITHDDINPTQIVPVGPSTL